jgi:hypothetical protein
MIPGLVESKFSLNNSETHEIAVNNFDNKFLELGLTKGRNWFLKFLGAPMILLRLMPVCVGLIMLAAYFCHSCKSQVEYNCALIKVD